MLAQGTVQFAVHIPVDFSRKLLRGERPDLLLEADATDPRRSVTRSARSTVGDHRAGPRPDRAAGEVARRPPPFNLVVHQHYNPENITQYNIVPGLMGVMLTMTMIIITALAITRERERGTMENLLSTPARPGEVMIGKIIPYIIVGYIQVFLILLAAKFLFNVPIVGQRALVAGADVFLHCGQPGRRHHLFDHRQEPASGRANGILFFPAVACCCRATCFRFAACRAGRRTLAKCCR